MRDRLKRLAAGLLETAKRNIEREGETLPVVAVMRGDRLLAVCGAVYGSSDEKRQVFTVIGEAIRRLGADGAVHVSDCYYTRSLPKAAIESPNFLAVSERSDRREGLSVMVVDAKGAEGSLMPYERTDGGIVFGEQLAWREVESNLVTPGSFGTSNM